MKKWLLAQSNKAERERKRHYRFADHSDEDFWASYYQAGLRDAYLDVYRQLFIKMKPRGKVIATQGKK